MASASAQILSRASGEASAPPIQKTPDSTIHSAMRS